jgi:hypothetical protein
VLHAESSQPPRANWWWWLVGLAITLDCAAPERGSSKSVQRAPVVKQLAQVHVASAKRTFPVSDYGASGADELDDTVAIQRAIDVAKGVPGSAVSLPAGTYYVSDQPPFDWVALRIDDARGLTLSGTGVEATHVVLKSGRDAHMISLTRCNDVTVTAMAIDGMRRGRKDTHGVRVADSVGVKLTELSIHSTAHYGIGLQQGRLQRIWIEHVRIDDTGGDGIDFKNTENDNDELSIRNVHISRPGQTSDKQTGLDIRGPASVTDLVVTGVPSGGTGIRFREDGPDTGRGGHRSTLSRFQIDGAPGSSGVAIAADDVTIATGVINGTDTGVVVLGNAARVSDVAVRGARYAFRITSEARAARLVSCTGDASRAGLWLEGAQAVVEKSRFAHNRACGICVRPSAMGAQLLANSFTDNGLAVDDQGAGTQIIAR